MGRGRPCKTAWQNGEWIPVPTFMDSRVFYNRKRDGDCARCPLDPMGSSAPKLPVVKGTINAIIVAARTAMALFCDAQAHPVPKFRCSAAEYRSMGLKVKIVPL